MKNRRIGDDAVYVRNHFTCDILAEKGSAILNSFKWGPSKFIHRTRAYPSGRPTEEQNACNE